MLEGDIRLLAGNWLAGTGNPLGPDLGAMLASLGLPEITVPEPMHFGLVVWGVAGVLLRRHRKSFIPVQTVH